MTSGGYAVVTTAYFPPVEYFMAAAATGHLLIEDSESYVKQSYRNRCRIYACDGILSMTVPVSAPDGDRGIKSVRIDYSKPWLQQHERALVSAYRTSAFFEYYQDELFAILDSRPQTLFELKTALTVKLLELLGLRCRVSFTGEYVQEYGPDVLDLRDAIHPKKAVPEDCFAIQAARLPAIVAECLVGFCHSVCVFLLLEGCTC